LDAGCSDGVCLVDLVGLNSSLCGRIFMGRIYRLRFRSIFENLAVEERLLRTAPVNSLLLYTSSPCVVIGRNQNVWKECNLPYIKSRNMTLARRRSGGGTVYHDPGNLCFSFISSSKDFDRRANASLVADALKGTFNLNAHVNERNDIFVNKTR